MTAVRTRIAPAPSGSIHVGNARTALYNWLYARKHGGTFILRIEDTDAKRATDEAYQAVIEDLRWLGLDWDEGPEVGGDFGPYRQSERMERYEAAAQRLIASEDAYRCYCTPDELAERRKAAMAEHKTPGYDGRCRHLSAEEIAAFEAEGREFAVRFAVPPDRTITFTDAVRGDISTDTKQIPDFVIQRSDGSPTYMLAAAVDDALMNLTHIIRGEDLIAATPRQLLLREAMAVADRPVFAHLPLLVDEKGKPLSKRWGDVAVSAYREQGYLPEAMVNYLALLGWSYDDKTNIFSKEELVDRFSLERVATNPARFDIAKLEWLNLHYIKLLSPSELAERLVPFCVTAGLDADNDEGRAHLQAVAPLISERLKRLGEAPPMVAFLFGPRDPDEKAAKVLEGQAEYLDAARTKLEQVEKWTSAEIEQTLRALAEARELKPKQAFQPIRAAVTGTLVSPPLFESLEVLGREETLARLSSAAA
ncbi:MAG: nondiscriminating glutamyl-tRNA synthetase [Actinomycetota bacterium]|jgi:glutamyl-tRNA synthetase|nr:nondiscriminating glutamyl-tRNA synthetase [Actinomycetota bacterium]